jgi:hypothetical protein
MGQKIKINKQPHQQTILIPLQTIQEESKVIMHRDSQLLRTRCREPLRTTLETIQEALQMKI